MTFARILGNTFRVLTVLILLPWAAALQDGQTGGSTGSGTRRDNSPQPGDSTPVPRRSPSQRQQRFLFVTGTVVREDGGPLPSSVVIERVCNGRTRKEAHVDSQGYFRFQVGANSNILPDASEDIFGSQGTPWGGASQPSGGLMGSDLLSPLDLIGCELRAWAPGYRSSTVLVGQVDTTGQIDIGTIVLQPVAKVTGAMVSATSFQAPKEARKALAHAEKALQKQRLQEAERDLQTAVEIYPRYAAAWFELGRIHQRLQRLEKAREAHGKALEADRNYVNPYVELARIAMMEEKWLEVADTTDRALTLDPLDFPEAFLFNSVANINLDRLDVAERSARKAQRLDAAHRFPQTHLLLANILQRKQDVTGAAEQLRNYLKFAPAAQNAGQVRLWLQDLERSGHPGGDQQTARK